MSEPWRRPGFTIPGIAAAAARKNHELGTAHRFNSEAAAAAGRRSWEKRRGIREREIAKPCLHSTR